MSLVFQRAFSCSTGVRARIGFIGLGHMGLGMAQNIRAKSDPGDQLVLYDVVMDSCKRVKGPNIQVASSIKELANDPYCDVVITMLPESSHVRSVYKELADAGFSKNDKRLFIDSSTCDIETSLAVHDLIKSKGLGQFVDAPVSGGVNGATNGTLTFMVGADDDGLTTYRPVLEKMGSKLFACGKPGAGLGAKLANNYILALTNIATSEGYKLADKLGLDMKLFNDIVSTSSGRSWNTEVNNPVPGLDPKAPSSRDYENGFGMSLVKKDLGLGLQAAKMAHVDVQLGPRGAEIYQKLCEDQAIRSKDMSYLYKWLEDHPSE